MSLDPSLLRAAHRALESAAIHSEIGRYEEACEHARIAIDVIESALGEHPYDVACRDGTIVIEGARP
jgi:hypothetical protein